MKLSWNSLKVSIAGARLSHLAQKDKIWDHGSMIEHARMVYYKVKRVKNNGNIDDLKKYCTNDCFEKLIKELDSLERDGNKWVIKNLVIKEASVIEVSEGKKSKPDCFTALLKVIGIEVITNKSESLELINYANRVRNFSEQWSFVRQGDWWLLDAMKRNK